MRAISNCIKVGTNDRFASAIVQTKRVMHAGVITLNLLLHLCSLRNFLFELSRARTHLRSLSVSRFVMLTSIHTAAQSVSLCIVFALHFIFTLLRYLSTTSATQHQTTLLQEEHTCRAPAGTENQFTIIAARRNDADSDRITFEIRQIDINPSRSAIFLAELSDTRG